MLFQYYVNSYKRSSAQTILRRLSKNGVGSKEIAAKHVMHIYEMLNIIPSAPDFDSIGNIISHQTDIAVSKTNLYGVIVETRMHPSLEFVVNHFVNNLKIPVQLFHGNNNLDFIMDSSLSSLVRNKRVVLTKLNTNDLNANQYNALLLSYDFWRSLVGREKILFFQTDSICCSKSNYSLNQFLGFDYIGSKWQRNRPVGLIIDGGNGGLSLRDWGKAIDCLRRFPPTYWTGGEDGYFAFHVELIGGKVAKDKDCSMFGTQYDFLRKSWGAHKISDLSKKNRSLFTQYCPEAEFMLQIDGA